MRTSEDPWCCGAVEIGQFYTENHEHYLNPNKYPKEADEIKEWWNNRLNGFMFKAFIYAIINNTERNNGIGKVLEELGFKEVAKGNNNGGTTCYFYVCSFNLEGEVIK
jgi:hypothetical protein